MRKHSSLTLTDLIDSKLYKQFGNSVAVPVIKALAKQIIKTVERLPSNNLKTNENI